MTKSQLTHLAMCGHQKSIDLLMKFSDKKVTLQQINKIKLKDHYKGIPLMFVHSK